MEEESIDFILNDGKMRGDVAVASFSKLKRVGLCIIDNAERYVNNSFKIPESIGMDESNITENWKYFIEKTLDWRKIWTEDVVSSTLILIKS